jgi:transcriptional regulator with XRE-family HTH domain
VKIAQVNPQAILAARTRASLTQAELAHRLRNAGLSKVTDRSVRRWETGRNVPSGNVIVALARVLDVDVDELYTTSGSDEDEDESDMFRLANELEGIGQIDLADTLRARARRVAAHQRRKAAAT